MEIDLSIIGASARQIVVSFLEQLPNIILGVIVLVAFVFMARGTMTFVKSMTQRLRLSEQAGIAVSRIMQWIVIILGVLVAMSIVFPSVNVSTLLGALGVTGVAIGFAFRDILQNFFAGLILLLSEPFKLGDQIVVGNYEGTVKRIETRATTIHMYDGRDVIIPNAELFTESVIVNTAHARRRSEYDVGISYSDDIDKAKKLILEAIQSVEGVLSEPEPEVLVIELADFTVNIRARWWTSARRNVVIKTHDKVLATVKKKLVANGITLPLPTYKVLFHS